VTGKPRKAGDLAQSASKEYGALLWRYLSRRVANREDVCELLQEVWVRLLRAGDEKDIMTPRAYIYRVARNVLYDFYHHKGRDDAVIVVDSDAAAHAAENPMQFPQDALPGDSDSEQNFQREIARLPTVHRQIIRMRIHDRMSHSEIASRLEVEVETVKRYLRMAIARLEKQQ